MPAPAVSPRLITRIGKRQFFRALSIASRTNRRSACSGVKLWAAVIRREDLVTVAGSTRLYVKHQCHQGSQAMPRSFIRGHHASPRHIDPRVTSSAASTSVILFSVMRVMRRVFFMLLGLCQRQHERGRYIPKKGFDHF